MPPSRSRIIRSRDNNMKPVFLVCLIVGWAFLCIKFSVSETFLSKLEACVFLSKHKTIFADGYTDQCFNKVKAGFSKRAVEDLLGPPLAIGRAREIREFLMLSGGSFFPETSESNRVVTRTQEIWFYSAPSGSSEYLSRVIYFESGKVTNKEARFYD